MNEFIGIDPAQLPHQLDERAGDLHVWYGSILLARFPWHTHVEPDERGNLQLFDLARQRWFREFPAGTWSTVNRIPRPAAEEVRS